jgi:hypothetical protein
VGNIPGGRETLERSQTGGEEKRFSWTLAARWLKYSETARILAGSSGVILGKAGAAETEAASAEVRKNVGRIV